MNKDPNSETRGKLVRGSVICEELDISSRTLQEYRDTHKVPFYRMSPRTIRYSLADVRAALAELKIDAVN